MSAQPMDQEEIIRRIRADLQDSYDEELEMEIEDRQPVMPPEKVAPSNASRSDSTRGFAAS